MKILWISDPPTTISAYGNQTALFLPRLKAVGHDVALFAMGGSAGSTQFWNEIPIYPTIADLYGNDIVAEHVKHFNADLVLTLGDPHVFDPVVYQSLPWLAWAPLDFETPTKATLRALSVAKWIWSPSRYGMESYIAAGLAQGGVGKKPDHVAYVPHGIDATVFKPGNRTTARKTFRSDFSPEFLVVSVAANKGTPSRKGFYETFATWKIFSENHKNAFLYLHTDPLGTAGGENLFDLINLVNADRNRVFFPPRYPYLTGSIHPTALATIYQTANVYLSTSHGEGLGLGAIEAQLSGTPVLLPRNTAQVETCRTGLLVDCTPYVPFDGATRWMRPNVIEIANALEHMYSERNKEPEPYAIRERVLEYDIDTVFKKNMLPALARIENQIRSRKK